MFLRVAERARRLHGTDLVGIFYKDNELIFKTRSGTHPFKRFHTQRVVIEDIDILKVRTLTPRDLENLIKQSKVKVYCSCEAFKYWGYQYIAWKKGYGIIKETRRPRVRNPYQQGFLCKHLFLVMQVYPFWASTLGRKFRENIK